MTGYASALSENLEGERYALAQTVRIAVWGGEKDMAALRPSGARKSQITDADYDETGLAEELASLGYIEVPRDE